MEARVFFTLLLPSQSSAVFGSFAAIMRSSSMVAWVGSEGRGEVADALFHGKTCLVKSFAEPGGGFHFFKTQLRMSMNAMAQFNQSLSAGFERFSRCRFRLHKLVAPPWEESLAER
jgi:hypothetical protein